MALTPDQKAVLELLLSGQSYADLEDLLGLEEAEVRARARAALTELGGTDPDRTVALGDYLLGQADPIGRADAVRHLRQDRHDHELATDIARKLSVLVPGADLPKLPPAPDGGGFLGRRADTVATETAAERRSPLAAVSKERGRLYAALAAGVVILVAAVLAVTGVFSGDDEPSDSAAASADGTGGGSGSEIPDGEEISRVPLLAPGGGDARGAAIVGLSTGDQPYLDLIIENLEQAPQGEAYVVWFMFDKRTGYPLSPIFPSRNGSFNDRFAIPQAVTSLIARTRSIEVSVSNARATLAEIQEAAQEQTFRIQRPGRTVLAGQIPRQAAAEPQN